VCVRVRAYFSLQLVASEGVTGAREAEGEAWCVNDDDVELAAREQAAAARNKRRQLLDDELGLDGSYGAFDGVEESLGLTRSGTRSGFSGFSMPPMPPMLSSSGRRAGGGGSTHKRKSEGGSHKAGASPARKKKRLAPASTSCLACTKGKHCAHTCGVRGKAAEAAAAAAKEEEEAAAAAGTSDE
jgi:hypothetical protein